MAGQILEQFYKKDPWRTFVKDFSRNFDPSRKFTAFNGCGLFTMHGHGKILENSSQLKRLIGF